VRPQTLPPNVLTHFYAGGPRIARFRGIELASDHMPEEWIGAVNTTPASAPTPRC
jgi:mannose-6-phosphate isomerase